MRLTIVLWRRQASRRRYVPRMLASNVETGLRSAVPAIAACAQVEDRVHFVLVDRALHAPKFLERTIDDENACRISAPDQIRLRIGIVD